MKHIPTTSKRGLFELLARTRDIQAAKMTLVPGGTSDEDVTNEHGASEQWLFVISGTGVARIGKRRSSLRTVKLRRNSLLVIQKHELHQIRNTGRTQLETINFYAPPAYNANAEPM